MGFLPTSSALVYVCVVQKHDPHCPVHNRRLKRVKRPYGVVYVCRETLCDVVARRSNDDRCYHVSCQATRLARIEAHNVFDKLWKLGSMSRSKAYSALAKHLGIRKSECHFRYFDVYTCQKAILFANSKHTVDAGDAK